MTSPLDRTDQPSGEVGEPPICSTCGDTGTFEQQGIRGAPGSGSPITCPDCGPTPVRAVEGDPDWSDPS